MTKWAAKLGNLNVSHLRVWSPEDSPTRCLEIPNSSDHVTTFDGIRMTTVLISFLFFVGSILVPLNIHFFYYNMMRKAAVSGSCPAVLTLDDDATLLHPCITVRSDYCFT